MLNGKNTSWFRRFGCPAGRLEVDKQTDRSDAGSFKSVAINSYIAINIMKDSATSKQLSKRFTLDEARAMLPLVRSIVSDICQVFRNVTGRRADLHRLLRKGARSSGQLYSDEIEESRADLQEEYDQIWQFRAELESLGIFLRQPEEGCIEFPTVLDGHEAFLLWRLGDDDIHFFRDAHSPQSTRTPLPTVEN